MHLQYFITYIAYNHLPDKGKFQCYYTYTNVIINTGTIKVAQSEIRDNNKCLYARHQGSCSLFKYKFIYSLFSMPVFTNNSVCYRLANYETIPLENTSTRQTFSEVFCSEYKQDSSLYEIWELFLLFCLYNHVSYCFTIFLLNLNFKTNLQILQ